MHYLSGLASAAGMSHTYCCTVHTSLFEVFNVFTCMFDGLAFPFITLSEATRQADCSQESGPVPLEEATSRDLPRVAPFYERHWTILEQGSGLCGCHAGKKFVTTCTIPIPQTCSSSSPNLLRIFLGRQLKYSPGQATLHQDRRDNRPHSCIIRSPECCV